MLHHFHTTPTTLFYYLQHNFYFSILLFTRHPRNSYINATLIHILKYFHITPIQSCKPGFYFSYTPISFATMLQNFYNFV